MILIACVDKNWGLGYKGELLFHIKHDMKRFKHITQACGICVMGANTFFSLPNCINGDPLPGRKCIVLSRSRADEIEKLNPNVIAVRSEFELFELLPLYDLDKVAIIGGGEIYRLFKEADDLNRKNNNILIDSIFITKVDEEAENCDTYLHNYLDDDRYVGTEENFTTDKGLKYTFYNFIPKSL